MKKYIASLLLAATLPVAAQQTTNQGIPYLLSQSVDMSQQFSDFSNIYFFADSLAAFDPATGQGSIKWKRQQLMPRQAFNTNTYLHQPLNSLDFPDTAYPQDPELSFIISPVSPNAIRIRVYTSPIIPAELADDPMLAGPVPDGSAAWTVTRSGDDVTYTSAAGSLTVEGYPWRLVLRDANGRMLTRTRCWGDNDSTQVKVAPFSFIKRGSDNSRAINPVFSLMPQERIYGCGESATALNKRGQKLNLFVTDPQGPETPDMYKPIPFFFSDRGYGIFMHTAAPVTVDFGASYIGATKLFMADEVMDFFIFFGQPKQILGEYTALTGRAQMPPLWSFGTWMSRITYFSEDEGREVARNLRANRIPCDVIHFDTGWFGTDWQCDYEFASDRFRNPAKMLSDLKKDGFHTSLWQLPYFTPKNRFFPELVERGLCVTNGCGGLPYEDAVLDFTNPATVAWYQEKIGKLIEMGVGAIKVDFGEGAPYLNGVYHNGRTGLYEHNLYPVRYNKAVADITAKTSGEHIIWARSAWAGSQRYPLHWGGDAATTNTGMEGTLREGLSFGLSGFTFWSHDIGGFVTDSPESLYRRWLPFGFLTSHTRVHGAPPTEPWYYGEEFTDYFRKCAEMKYALMPYVYTQACESSRDGLPMMRALLLEYPDDSGVWSIEDEYLFGTDLLVAPMLEDAEGRNVYVPGNRPWINYFTNEVVQPGWHYLKWSEMPVIVLARDGANIPHIPVEQCTDKLDWSKVYWRAYSTDPTAPAPAKGTLITPPGK